LKTWYYAELAGFYMLTEDTAKANETIYDYLAHMYPQQISQDGNQPSETGHSVQGHRLSFNLEGIITLAKIGDEIGVDIWHRKTDQGATILTAVQYLLSHNLGTGSEVWHLAAAVRAKYGSDVIQNIKITVSASNRNPGLQSLSNDHPPIEAFNAWPSAKKSANPSGMNIRQHIGNIGNNRGIGPKPHRGDAISLQMACFQNLVIGLITVYSMTA
jgi:Alginate lyase